MFENKRFFIQMAPYTKTNCEEQKLRTFLTSRRLLVEVCSSCLYSCTYDWYSDLQASISTPFIQVFSRSPSSNMSNSCIGEWSSPTINTGGQKQLRPSSNDRQHTVHEVFEEFPAVPLELFLQLEAPDFRKGYQHTGTSKEMLFFNRSNYRMVGSDVLLPLLH